MSDLEHLANEEPIGSVDGIDVVSGKPVFPLGPHAPRRADIDPKAARRAERQVAIMFASAALLILGFVVVYVKVPTSKSANFPIVGNASVSNVLLGTLFGLGMFLIGAGAIHWAKKLMPDVEVAEERHEMRSTPTARQEFAAAVKQGAAESGFGERKIIRRTLLGALALFPIPLVVLLRDLGPMPGTRLRKTLWDSGVHIVTDPTMRKLRPEDIPIGGLVNAIPENLAHKEEEDGNLNERGKASIILVRMDPADIVSQQGKDWDYQGILAYSKICTHVGCPISLYQQRTHHLLCPCHQSTFDLSDSGNVVFGPAARRMPQLAITVDAEGYLVAKQGFAEPVGPSFWERG
ncbi:MAG: Rieske (2Fe-2S) protein [Actinobacteria bacterium]|nr:Rieske (2Fe-2S) protein [Actinomycetota bacterium]NBY15399.1 Rieske (2Fe-2S) protein [Actinomycetota bacterium]